MAGKSLAERISELPRKGRGANWLDNLPAGDQRELLAVKRAFQEGQYNGISFQSLLDGVREALPAVAIGRVMFTDWIRKPLNGTEAKPGK